MASTYVLLCISMIILCFWYNLSHSYILFSLPETLRMTSFQTSTLNIYSISWNILLYFLENNTDIIILLRAAFSNSTIRVYVTKKSMLHYAYSENDWHCSTFFACFDIRLDKSGTLIPTHEFLNKTNIETSLLFWIHSFAFWKFSKNEYFKWSSVQFNLSKKSPCTSSTLCFERKVQEVLTINIHILLFNIFIPGLDEEVKCTEKIVKHWNGLPREKLESSSLQVLKKWLDLALSAMLKLIQWC